MARQTQMGLDYFPMDTDFDSKTTLFLAEIGPDGWAFITAIWQVIYGDEGYFVKYDKDLAILIKMRTGIDTKIVDQCINICLERDIFDQQQFKNNKILTSKGIQKRYFMASKRKKFITVERKYLLIDEKDISNKDVVFSKNGQTVNNNSITANTNPINVSNNSTKENKNKSKIKDEEKEEDIFNDDVIKIYNEFLKTLPKKLYPGTKKLKNEWLKSINECYELDGYTYERILKICIHYRNDIFWKENFKSPLKLRRRNKDGVKYIDYFDDNLTLSRDEIIAAKNKVKLKELGVKE